MKTNNRLSLMHAVLSLNRRSKKSKVRREELENKPSTQIGTGAQSTEKNNKKYLGYKDHIRKDAESKITRKRTFTPANVHDNGEIENVLSCADKVDPRQKDKKTARTMGIYHGVLVKVARNNSLTIKHQKRNLFGSVL